jgi:hypothetical protein
VPSVREKMSHLKMEQEALLILHNAPGHPDELMSDDGQITVMFLPCRCTPLLQPMGQNVIQTVIL